MRSGARGGCGRGGGGGALTSILALHFDGGLVGLDLTEHVSHLDLLADRDQP